jgi:hypothetical protein
VGLSSYERPEVLVGEPCRTDGRAPGSALERWATTGIGAKLRVTLGLGEVVRDDVAEPPTDCGSDPGTDGSSEEGPYNTTNGTACASADQFCLLALLSSVRGHF